MLNEVRQEETSKQAGCQEQSMYSTGYSLTANKSSNSPGQHGVPSFCKWAAGGVEGVSSEERRPAR